jgi:hypothetical protein
MCLSRNPSVRFIYQTRERLRACVRARELRSRDFDRSSFVLLDACADWLDFLCSREPLTLCPANKNFKESDTDGISRA